MTTTPVHLATCAACTAYPAGSVFACDVPQPKPFYCPKCRRGLLTGEEQLASEHPELRFIDENPYVRWCVLEILGDGYFLTRLIGLPSSPVRRRHVTEIAPRFSYAKLTGARR